MTDAVSRRRFIQGALACAALSAFPAPAFPQAIASARFDQRETQAIRDYYRMQVEKARAARGKGGGVPPGMPRRDELPPGIVRQIRAGATLPPGLTPKGLPAELERSLPIRAGTVRIIAADMVLLVDAKNMVREVIELNDILDRLYSR